MTDIGSNRNNYWPFPLFIEDLREEIGNHAEDFTRMLQSAPFAANINYSLNMMML